jgi:hypothetical protein
MRGSVLLAQTFTPPAQSGSPPLLIILIGPLLSGKTTFVESISATYAIPPVSTGDLVKDNSAGQFLSHYSEETGIADLVEALVRLPGGHAYKRLSDHGRKFTPGCLLGFMRL